MPALLSPPPSPPAATRPRERLLARGPQALADAELLALLLRTGCRGRSVLQVAQATLERSGGLGGLRGSATASPALARPWPACPASGPARRAELMAAFELARRAAAQALARRAVFSALARCGTTC
jgi:DNA repair protein RadC